MNVARSKSVSTALASSPPWRLNVGCGRNALAGWVNVDAAALPGVDIVCDLEAVRARPIALPDESVESFLLSHVIEHVRDSLGLMQELWRLARPAKRELIALPHIVISLVHP